MKISIAALSILTVSILGIFSIHAQEEAPGMTKMCLFYPSPSGHARSDPILNQSCASDHVHTFYGPQNFHPNTSYEQIRDTSPQYSTSPVIENQSLYWHPSIYEVGITNGQKTYSRVSDLESSPYYRWNTSTSPETVAFPPGFRMIAFSNQEGADQGGEGENNLFVGCCDFTDDGEEDCTSTSGNPLIFPTTACDVVGVAMAMPTCWDETKGIGTNDPFGHVTYTIDGTVGGPCPAGYNTRVPQVQLFVRIVNYKGGTYELSDGSDVFHVDFMNGWQEGKLDEIISGCEPTGEPGYNPPCDCDQFLTTNEAPASAVCDSDVKEYILNEDTNIVASLPRGTCQGTNTLIPKIWAVDPPFLCSDEPPADDDDLSADDESAVDDDDDLCTDSDLEFKVNRRRGIKKL